MLVLNLISLGAFPGDGLPMGHLCFEYIPHADTPVLGLQLGPGHGLINKGPAVRCGGVKIGLVYGGPSYIVFVKYGLGIKVMAQAAEPAVQLREYD